MKAKQGFVFYDKPFVSITYMIIVSNIFIDQPFIFPNISSSSFCMQQLAFAKTKSQVIARQEGKGKGETVSNKANKRSREEVEVDEDAEEGFSAKESRNL
jgi:hypothetical protein